SVSLARWNEKVYLAQFSVDASGQVRKHGCMTTSRVVLKAVPHRRSNMTQSTKFGFIPFSPCLLLMTPGISSSIAPPHPAQPTAPEGAAGRNGEASQALVLLRGLPTLGTKHSIAIVELNPEAKNFGTILQEVEVPDLTLPLHHLYYSPNGRLYSTCLDPKS